MDIRRHWEHVYQTRALDAVSWFRRHLDTSLALLKCADVSAADPVIDVGGGASSFVDDLLEAGFRDVTVLDISSTALDATKSRLGARAGDVTWIVADVINAVLPAERYRLWHDRAVFHFLTATEERDRYVVQVKHAVAPGGYLLLATFGPEGPLKCSGLPTARYSAHQLQALFLPEFARVDSCEDRHTTPAGVEQQFVYCL